MMFVENSVSETCCAFSTFVKGKWSAAPGHTTLIGILTPISFNVFVLTDGTAKCVTASSAGRALCKLPGSQMRIGTFAIRLSWQQWSLRSSSPEYLWCKNIESTQCSDHEASRFSYLWIFNFFYRRYFRYHVEQWYHRPVENIPVQVPFDFYLTCKYGISFCSSCSNISLGGFNSFVVRNVTRNFALFNRRAVESRTRDWPSNPPIFVK